MIDSGGRRTRRAYSKPRTRPGVLPAFGLSIGNIFIGVDGEWLAMAAAVKPRSHNVRAYRGRAALNPTDRYAWALGVGVFLLVAVSGSGQPFRSVYIRQKKRIFDGIAHSKVCFVTVASIKA